MTKTLDSRKQPASPPPAPLSSPEGSGPAVLLVDDQPGRLLAYEAVLSGLGVECVKAGSGQQALARFLTQRFAVVLLDVRMPDMDGFEVARHLRQHPRHGGTPIIFVTAADMGELELLKGYEAGAIDYISMPVAPEVLRSKVAVLVELHQRRSELEEINRQLEDARSQLESKHAQDLAEREEQLRAIFEHPSELTVVLKAQRDVGGEVCDWIYRSANRNALRLLKREASELVGHRLSEVLPDRAARLIPLCAQVLASNEPYRYETRDGEGHEFLITLFPIGNDMVVSSAVDITDRKRTETALRASEERFRALVDEATVAIAHNAMDGRFQYANKAFCRMLGYTVDELLTRTWQEVTHPDDREADRRAGARVLSGELTHYTIEKRYLRKDGGVVWVHMFGNFAFDEAGRPQQGVAIAVDITQRKQDELALRESEERFRTLANGIDQMAWTCDELGRATWYNDRWYEFTGCTPQQMLGDGWKSVIEPGHLGRVMDHLQSSTASGQAWEDTVPIRGRSGEYRWFLSRAMPIRDASGRVARWFGTNTDVTELNRLKTSLEEADRRKDEFLAMLAHELRNPVAPIRNAAEVLAMTLQGDPRASGLVGIVQRQVGHLARILDDLLDVSRITRGKFELRRELIDVAACMQSAVEAAMPESRAKNHRLVVLAGEGLQVFADKVRLEQCIGNLLANAVKYTDQGGEIELRSFADGEDAVITVRDNGSGIGPEFLPKVFELFSQGARAIDRSNGGLGLGLTICKRLVESHGGSISCHSDGPGRGSTFTIRLPRSTRGKGGDVSARTVVAGLRILVVDDNRDAADTLALWLKMKGHAAEAVYEADAALRRVASDVPDVALLDLGLPGMDGFELARRLRAAFPGLRLVALSGYGQPADRERSAAAGFDAHVLKPVEMAVLEQALRAG